MLLAEALKINSTLTELDLSDNNIGTKGAEALAKALQINSTLTKLDLWNNNIGDNGAAALAKALKENSTLTSLYLRVDKIGAEGAVLLAEALKTNSTLTTLDLQYNDIGNEDAGLLAEALKINSTLTTLDLEGNAIDTKGAEALAEALKTNSTLTRLDLNDNKIGDVELKGHIKHLLDRNKLIQEAVLDSLKEIAAGDDVEYIDIREIENIQHIESIKNPIINPLDRYLDNEEFFKEKLQECGLGLNVEILDAKIDLYKASPLLKTEDIKADETKGTVETNYSKLHIDGILGNIGSYLTAKDARVLKEAFSSPKKASENPSDGSGGGGMTKEEIAEEQALEEQARSNQEDADVDAAISNSLWELAFDNTGAAGAAEEASEMTGEVAQDS